MRPSLPCGKHRRVAEAVESLKSPAGLAFAIACLTVNPGDACTMEGREVQLHESVDGRLTWLSHGWPVDKAHEWFGIRRAQVGERGQEFPAPLLTEGTPSLVAALADGRTWWKVHCAERDPPQTAACKALILASAGGEIVGRADHEFTSEQGEVWSDTNGTLWQLTHQVPGLPGRQAERSLLVLRRAAAQPVAGWRPPEDAATEGRRVPTNQGWVEQWRIEWPTPPLVGQTGAPIWAVNGHLLASLQSNGEQVEVGVFELVLDRQLPVWRTRWRRTWAHVQSAETRVPDGELVLAPARVVLASSGRVALGPWRYRPDCSFVREGGAVLLDETGGVVREIDTTWGLYGTWFTNSQDLVIAEHDGRRIFDRSGYQLRSEAALPRAVTQEQLRREAAMSALDERSTAAQFLEAIGPGDTDQLGHALPDLSNVARQRIVEAWPEVDPMVSRRLWIQLASELCAQNPTAGAGLSLARFRAARLGARLELLDDLPDCLPQPPADIVDWVRRLADRRGWGMREAAERALARWSSIQEPEAEGDLVAGSRGDRVHDLQDATGPSRSPPSSRPPL